MPTSAQNDDLWLYARTNKVDKLAGALAAGAAIDRVDEAGRTPLINAAASRMDCSDAVKALLDRGADHNLSDEEGHKPLMFAAWRGYHASVRHLLAAGADPNATDNSGRTALDYARMERHSEVVELLLPLTRDPWAAANTSRLQDLDASLCEAVVSLIRRAEAEGMRGKVQTEQFPELLQTVVPNWYVLMITSVPLAGIAFESPTPKRDWPNGGWFRHVGDLIQVHSSSYPEIEILKDGYFAFAQADNGDVWVLRSAAHIYDPVYLWDLSGMEAIKACDSFPEFLRAIRVEKLQS